MTLLSSLTAISPLDGRYHTKTKKLSVMASEFALIRHRLFVEICWLMFLADHKGLPEVAPLSNDAAQYLMTLFEDFDEEDASAIKMIEQEINHDVKAVEYFLKDKLIEHDELNTHAEWIHFACTSEDINNLAYALMLKELLDDECQPTMALLIEAFRHMAKQYSATPMLSRTHGQAASPTTLGKEMAVFAHRLQQQYNHVASLPIMGKCNGAVGHFNAHTIAFPNVDWLELSEAFVESLGLMNNAYTTQIEPHDALANLFHAVALFNTILMDACRDIWSYISLGYLQQKSKAQEVGSSTMPHKINPIDFENAEGNLGLANALFQFFAQKLPISRWQRDLSDSTVLRNIGSAFAYASIAYQSTLQGLSKLSVNADVLKKELDDHWEVLAEAVQTMMRKYGLETPYEQLKALTRGKTLSQKNLHRFIDELDLPEDAKDALKQLRPETYVGRAEALANLV